MTDLEIHDEVRDNLHEWGLCNGEGTDCTATQWIHALLGWRGDDYDLLNAIRSNEVDISKLRPFAGVNGYALYKAWRAKHGRQTA